MSFFCVDTRFSGSIWVGASWSKIHFSLGCIKLQPWKACSHQFLSRFSSRFFTSVFRKNSRIWWEIQFCNLDLVKSMTISSRRSAHRSFRHFHSILYRVVLLFLKHFRSSVFLLEIHRRMNLSMHHKSNWQWLICFRLNKSCPINN